MKNKGQRNKGTEGQSINRHYTKIFSVPVFVVAAPRGRPIYIKEIQTMCRHRDLPPKGFGSFCE